MSAIMTVVGPRGRRSKGEGLMLYGRQTREHIIGEMRKMYAHRLEEAERLLAMKDEDFEVEIVRGVHVQRLIERLEP